MKKIEIHIVLYQPEIPQNTGNIIRQCAAMEAMLHIIEPASFSLSDKHIRRAGLDYWFQIKKTVHKDWQNFLHTALQEKEYNIENLLNLPLYPVSTMGFHQLNGIKLPDKVYFLFGSESSGLPPQILNFWCENSIQIPQTGKVRSLNLANSAAIVLYEAYRQMHA